MGDERVSAERALRTAAAQRALEGLSLGDAFGERFFGRAEEVQRNIAARTLPKGPWPYTDDTMMAIVVVDVLRCLGRIDQDALAKGFTASWVREPDRGYGGGAHALLHRLALGADFRTEAKALFDGGSFGNGAAMRVAPLGAYFAEDPPDVILREASASAEVTHTHAEGRAGAIAVPLAAAHARLHGPGGASTLLPFVLAHTPAGETRDGILAAHALAVDTSVEEAARKLGTGQRVSAMDTVPFTLFCARRHLGDFEAALWSTIAGLGDRDTTCAIVGGIVALAAPETLPAAWLDAREPLPER